MASALCQPFCSAIVHTQFYVKQLAFRRATRLNAANGEYELPLQVFVHVLAARRSHNKGHILHAWYEAAGQQSPSSISYNRPTSTSRLT